MTVTVHIEDVEPAAVTDALVAIELAAARGVLDVEQRIRLEPLVTGLRRLQMGRPALRVEGDEFFDRDEFQFERELDHARDW